MTDTLIVVLLVLIFLLLFGRIQPSKLKEDIKEELSHDLEKYNKHNNSKQADNYNYNKTAGKFTNITQCSNCKATDEYWSQHPASACPYCGGKVRDTGSGIYINGYWYSNIKEIACTERI